MQIRRRLDSRSQLDDQFVISMDFHELAQVYAGCSQALRSIRTPLPSVEALVEAIEQMAMSEENATIAGLKLTQAGPTPSSARELSPPHWVETAAVLDDLTLLRDLSGLADGPVDFCPPLQLVSAADIENIDSRDPRGV